MVKPPSKVLHAQQTDPGEPKKRNASMTTRDDSRSKNSSRDQILNHAKRENKKYNNKCLRCLCIVFCCADSNINGEDEKIVEDEKHLLNRSEEEIDFDKSRPGSNPTKDKDGVNSTSFIPAKLVDSNTAKNSKNSSQVIQKMDMHAEKLSGNEDEEEGYPNDTYATKK